MKNAAWQKSVCKGSVIIHVTNTQLVEWMLNVEYLVTINNAAVLQGLLEIKMWNVWEVSVGYLIDNTAKYYVFFRLEYLQHFYVLLFNFSSCFVWVQFGLFWRQYL